MKAVVVSKAGGPEVLEVREVTKPQVKTGWSLVKIKGVGINHSEIFTRQGLSPSVVFPRILGIELVGVIEKTTEPDRLPVGPEKIFSLDTIQEAHRYLEGPEAFGKVIVLNREGDDDRS